MTDLSSLFTGGGGGGNVYAPSDLTDNALIRGDGGAKNAQTSTVLVSDAGEMTNPSQPAVLAIVTSDVLNVTGDGTLYSMAAAIWTEIYDQNSDFTNGTFTAPVTGKYNFSITFSVTGIGATHTSLILSAIASNRTILFVLNPWAIFDSINGLSSVNFTSDIDMDANDTLYFDIKISGGTKVADLWEGTYMSVKLVM
jgi:hypothetical protein